MKYISCKCWQGPYPNSYFVLFQTKDGQNILIVPQKHVIIPNDCTISTDGDGITVKLMVAELEQNRILVGKIVEIKPEDLQEESQ